MNPDNLTDTGAETVKAKTSSDYLKFPATEEDKQRLSNYDYYERLFFGDHFEAFNIRVDDDNYSKAYRKLRYVTANFAGLVSKVIADFLFSEPLKFKVEDGDQEFVDALVRENNLHTQNYESALTNSYLGDAVFKLRVGKRHSNDEKSTIIIEDITPRIYFPQVDPFNVRATPERQELAWIFTKGAEKYLRKEIHEPGKITNELYLMNGDKIAGAADLSILGIDGLLPVEETKINRSLIIHVPNWKVGNRVFGISDYYDLDSLFYAVNNRMSKVDNILDKHSDPILMLPDGILDDDGNVKRSKLHLIEMPSGESNSQKPEYIVWNASLDNAFKEIDKLVEFLYMVSETSPDILGMGSGKSDSGRALKLKIMRTLAKAARKKLYYDPAIKEVIYVAQLLAKAWNVECDGVPLSKAPVVPELEWGDGLPIDNAEQVDIESKRLSDGNTTVVDSIMRLDGVDEATAKKKAKDIKDENAIPLVTNGTSGNIPKPGDPANPVPPVKPKINNMPTK